MSDEQSTTAGDIVPPGDGVAGDDRSLRRVALFSTMFSATRLRSRWKLLVGSAAAAVMVVAAAFVAVPAALAAAPCDNPANAIVAENCKEGTPSDQWDIWGAGDDSIQGYATDISVNVGSSISFKIQTDAHAYTIDIYRLGYYGGDGARKITSITPSVPLPQTQPACVTDPSTLIYECGAWHVSASWSVPSTAVSGVYIARLTRTDDGGASHIPFVVRNDASHSELTYQTSDTTWQAYNTYGGANFYTGTPGRAYKLSYNRPFATRGGTEQRDFLFSNEYPMIRFLEQNGYDMSYTTGIDSDRRGNLIKNHKVFLSVGHDEYWSGQQRANVEAARDAGVSLAFFSGNEVYWKTRWESSEDGTNTAYRTLVCYKETWANDKIDPTTEWTGTWRDPRFTPPANGGRPENALTGTAFIANHDDLAVQVSAAEGKLRLWRGTNLTSMAPGTSQSLAPHSVGYESDEDVDNGFRPAGLIHLSTTVGESPETLIDYGNTVVPGTTTHHLTLYRAASGALVFSAGTIQWAWGLDTEHDGDPGPVDTRMQQATINILADMGSQPTTRMSTLQPATASADTQAPTTVFTTPANGATVTNGALVTVAGTASDAGGGQVAGVEVSTDGGSTWHAATGTTSWTYSFYSNGVGTQAVMARASDDSARLGVAANRSLTLSGPSSLFGARLPKTVATTDGAGVELGVKFTPTSDGSVVGVRFYKGTGNTGSHSGSLWSTGGTRLATGTFSGESATGWQTLMFSTPVQVSRDVTYIASYNAPNGHYAADSDFFSGADWTATPLVAPRSQSSGGNGVYRSGSGFPLSTFGNTNYWVDPLFVEGDATAPTVLVTTPANSAANVDIGAHPTATFSKPVNPASIQFTLTDATSQTVAGATSYNATTRVATFTPNAPLSVAQAYTGRVTAEDAQGTATPGPTTWTFTTTQYASLQTLFATNATPLYASTDDPNPVTLGVKFTPAVDGKVVGIRSYQGPGNSGNHTGSLYSSTGTLLARASFTDEGTGWQSVYFSTPINVTAGTTYVAAYFAPNGNYAYDPGYFGVSHTNGSLTGVSGDNGVFTYGGDLFPTNSWNSSNYWVDPLFLGTGSPPVTPSPSATPSPTPAQPPTMPSGAATIFASTATPASANWPDTSSIEVGVTFTSDVAGQVAGVRFYKGATNTGVHTGSLWSSTGTQLATGTFVESASGWQTLLFTAPVTITAGTTYVASYHTNVGYYAVDIGAFATAFAHVPLHVTAGGGRYIYGAGGYPSNSADHNYWVDVILLPS